MKFCLTLLERHNSSSSSSSFFGKWRKYFILLWKQMCYVFILYLNHLSSIYFYHSTEICITLIVTTLWLRQQVSDGRVNGTSCYLLFKTYTDLYQSDQRLQNLGRRGTGTSYRRGQQETKSDKMELFMYQQQKGFTPGGGGGYSIYP